MFVQLRATKDGKMRVLPAVLLQYKDPTISALVTSAPSVRFQHETGQTSCPPVFILSAHVKNGKVVYRKKEGFLRMENEQLVVFGITKDQNGFTVNLEKYGDVNKGIATAATESGVPKQIPCHSIENGRIKVNWFDVTESLMTTAAAYVGALTISVALQTGAMLYETMRDQIPYAFNFKQETNLETSAENVFWVFIPFPRPASLIDWLSYLTTREEEISWHSVSPLVEGFYLAKIESNEEGGALIRFLKGKPEDAQIERGQYSRLCGNFSGRAKLNGNVQVGISAPGEGANGSIAWGCHSDHRILTVLPVSADFEICRFGPVRTSFADELGDLEKAARHRRKTKTGHLARLIRADANKEASVLKSFSDFMSF